ncbi:hypothetical protein TNCV_634261 [Trichonephila clavipes]|nr:hypothetical protein TNCV_634261 [Trichonephila clavipes]
MKAKREEAALNFVASCKMSANAVSYTITYRNRDIDQDRRYPHLHWCPNTYW